MKKKDILILAIESSCDDTSVAVLHNNRVLSNITANQDVHKKYGGVIPELASRSHEKNMIPVVREALSLSGVDISSLDAIAFTQGPGLPGSLIVGNAFAKSLALVLNIPLIAVNHMQAHVLAHFIENEENRYPEFPFICLTVSGGHTQLVLVCDFSDLKVVGTTLDDAAGEAFDKIAKMLGLEYPGGPVLDRLALNGDPDRFTFPKPRVGEFNYSFSGFKTSVLYFLRDNLKTNKDFISENLADICASVQKCIVDILLENLEKCATHYNINQIALAGGVSANSALRKKLKEKESELTWKTFIPPLEYCTDNAAMIGVSAYYKFQKSEFEQLDSVASARLIF